MRISMAGKKLIFIIFNILFAGMVITLFTANRLYIISMYSETPKISLNTRIALIDTAQKLEPLNADYHYAKYRLLDADLKQVKDVSELKGIRKIQLSELKKAIALRPTWPLYHMVYALTLENSTKTPNIITRQTILSEMQKAVQLKNNNKKYQDIYNKYKERYAPKSSF